MRRVNHDWLIAITPILSRELISRFTNKATEIEGKINDLWCSTKNNGIQLTNSFSKLTRIETMMQLVKNKLELQQAMLLSLPLESQIRKDFSNLIFHNLTLFEISIILNQLKEEEKIILRLNPRNSVFTTL